MLNVLVTGSAGFVGRNLIESLRRAGECKVWEYDRDFQTADLPSALAQADVVFHLAGENRPADPKDFETVNVGLTSTITQMLTELGRKPRLVFASSIQAENYTPYGVSKRRAEEELQRFASATGCQVITYRFKNVFGKWCRPSYNSVVATFCYNVSHDLPITVSDPDRVIDFVYIDDVVDAFLGELNRPATPGFSFAQVSKSDRVTLGTLAEMIRGFRATRSTRHLPDFADRFTRALYATYLSYLDTDDFSYPLEVKADSRGNLAEFIKSEHFGQVFMSTTAPSVTRGNHFHHTKTEKFFVIQGEAEIRLRRVGTNEVLRYRVSGTESRVVDIPPGYTHAIENIGATDLITLFWSSEVFDPSRTDTYPLEVEA